MPRQRRPPASPAPPTSPLRSTAGDTRAPAACRAAPSSSDTSSAPRGGSDAPTGGPPSPATPRGRDWAPSRAPATYRARRRLPANGDTRSPRRLGPSASPAAVATPRDATGCPPLVGWVPIRSRTPPLTASPRTASPPTASSCSAQSSFRTLVPKRTHGQKRDRHDRAPAPFTGDCDRTSPPVDQPTADRQAEPASAGSRREPRLEDAWHDVFRDAVTVVLYRHD